MRVVFCLLAISASAYAHADDATLGRCRSLSDPVARLACYDAIPLAAAAPASVAAVVPAAAVAAAPTMEQQQAAFGREATSKAERLEQIETSIKGHFSGWTPYQLITLANGQVWRVVDDSEGVAELDNPKVTVERGSLGSFFLDIDGITHAPRVRRVQ